jgi:N-acetylglucosaminyldiphosphoundecaprenol N-acetyl-beta-D-mannosaminyltransferase
VCPEIVVRSSARAPCLQSVDVLGVRVSAVNMSQAITIITSWIVEGARDYVCVTGVHGVMESQRDESIRRIHNAAGLVVPDGMPLVWMAQRNGFRHVDRVYGPDLMLACCAHFQGPLFRHYFYGGADGVADRLVDRLKDRFPSLVVAGTYSPPFRALSASEQQDVATRINAAQPDIVWVGLSTPKQEQWMSAHRGLLQAPVLIGVGAAFDFLAGLKKQAPRWMQRSGLEWGFRLAAEPQRLWRRYFRNNPEFLWRVLKTEIAGRRACHADAG